MATELQSNNASTTLALALPASGTGSTTLTVAAGTGNLFPMPGAAVYPPGETTFFRLSLTDAVNQSTHEIVYVTARNGDQMSVTRAQEGTAAQNWNAGDIAFNGNTAGVEGKQIQDNQLQSGWLTYAVATGTASSISANLPVNALSRMNDGIQVAVKIPLTTSGPLTLNLNGYGAMAVVNKLGLPIRAGELVGGQIYNFVANGSNWCVENGTPIIPFFTDNSQTPGLVNVTTGATMPALSRGLVFFCTVANTNTSDGVRVVVDSLPFASALANDGTIIKAGSMKAGGTYRFTYNGTSFTTDVSNPQSLPVGSVVSWWGALANVASVWGPGWQVADGTNGTPDLRDRVIVGAGSGHAYGTAGGRTAVTLSTNELPNHGHGISQTPHGHHAAWDHAHGVSDPGHAHGVSQTPHAHGVSDPGHQHAYHVIAQNTDSGGQGAVTGGARNVGWDGQFDGVTDGSGTGIWIQGANANIGINTSGTGIGIQNFHTEIDTQGSNANISVQATGNSAAFNIEQPWFALWTLIRVA